MGMASSLHGRCAAASLPNCGRVGLLVISGQAAKRLTAAVSLRGRRGAASLPDLSKRIQGDLRRFKVFQGKKYFGQNPRNRFYHEEHEGHEESKLFPCFVSFASFVVEKCLSELCLKKNFDQFRVITTNFDLKNVWPQTLTDEHRF